MKRIWTKEECIKDALNYNSRSEWSMNSGGAFQAAHRSNWVFDCCKHMIEKRKPSGYWTFIQCQNEALKYNTRKEFQKNSVSAYSISHRNNWLDLITSHMRSIGNKTKRLIYSCEFPDNSVYVGLTHDFDERREEHLNPKRCKKSSVQKYILKTKTLPLFKKLTKYVDFNVATKREGEFLEKYKNSGWKILNKNKTGALGGSTKFWTKENCIKEALKYDSKLEFRRNANGAYQIICKNNWINECCSHMKMLWRKKWNKETCSIEAKKYSTKKDFNVNSTSAYQAAYKNGFLNEICSHMMSQK